MPSGWDIYYVVFFSAALALGIPLGLGLLSILFSPGGPRTGERRSGGTALDLTKRINVRFFLATNATLLLIALMLIIVPAVGALGGAQAQQLGRRAHLRILFAIVSVAGFAAVGLLYSSRKGDLSWLQSFQDRNTGAGTKR